MKEARSQKPEARRAKRRAVVLLPFLTLASGFWLLASGPPASRPPQQDTLKVDVNLVNVFVAVKDAAGNFVTDLTRNDFHVYDDDELQKIDVFETQEQVGSSIGIVLDTSGSMVDILPFMKTGIREFARTMPKGDDFFVFSFGSSARLVHSASQSQKHLEDSLRSMRAYGTSVMYDGLVYAIDKVDMSDLPRKAVIVFTDGNDNGSKSDYNNVVGEAQQSGCLIYFVAIGSRLLIDTRTLESLSDLSAGRTFYIAKGEAVPPVLDQIRADLAHQYYLGYYAPRRPGSHRIRVEIPGRDVKIRAKSGYVDQ
jgi:Ca-activated chloride channel homolog